MSTDNRIESLETQVRTLKRVVYTMCGLFLAAGLLAATNMQSAPDVIRAKKFEVVTDAGKAVVSLQSILHEEVHYGTVTTLNSKGGTLVDLSASTDGYGMVDTQNGKGQTLVLLTASTEGYGLVESQNGKGVTLVRLGTYTGLNGGYVETFTQTGVSTSEIP